MAKKRRGPTPRKQNRNIRMRVIPEPEEGTRTVLKYVGEGTVIMSGPGNVIMECGNCGVPLIEGLSVAQIQNLVFPCPSCGAFNETLA
jgi:predicted RNA-binding Zn-ribbon protein involved in translation (DUF1610 family)